MEEIASRVGAAMAAVAIDDRRADSIVLNEVMYRY